MHAPRLHGAGAPAGLAAAVLLTALSPVFAEVPDDHWNLTYQFGGAFLSREIGDDNLTSAVRVGYGFSPWVGLEGGWNSTSTQDVTDDSLDAKVDFYGLDLLYHFHPDGVSVPYVLLGAGLVEVDLERASGSHDSDTSFFWNYGGGVKIPVNKRIDIRFDVRIMSYRLDSTDPAPAPLNGSLFDTRFSTRAFTLGVGWHFPGDRPERPKAEPPAPPQPPAEGTPTTLPPPAPAEGTLAPPPPPPAEAAPPTETAPPAPQPAPAETPVPEETPAPAPPPEAEEAPAPAPAEAAPAPEPAPETAPAPEAPAESAAPAPPPPAEAPAPAPSAPEGSAPPVAETPR